MAKINKLYIISYFIQVLEEVNRGISSSHTSTHLETANFSTNVELYLGAECAPHAIERSARNFLFNRLSQIFELASHHQKS